jgi:hypothetical protein
VVGRQPSDFCSFVARLRLFEIKLLFALASCLTIGSDTEISKKCIVISTTTFKSETIPIPPFDSVACQMIEMSFRCRPVMLLTGMMPCENCTPTQRPTNRHNAGSLDVSDV